MKRRNAETGKVRRSLKRTKISEGMYGNSLQYLKVVLMWATVMMVDFMLEFKFEFLWPIWMALRYASDAFKYKGISYSVFFICTALTSDVICFFFLPLSWMFIVASTYVWLQFVWYTMADKGIGISTVALCLFIAWVESGARWTERHGWLLNGGLGLSRPLAAHCVGFPAVVMGFSIKSYVFEILRVRRQRRVREENDMFFQLMREALPESAMENVDPKTNNVDPRSNNVDPRSNNVDPKSNNVDLKSNNVDPKSNLKDGGGLTLNGGVDERHNNMNGSARRKSGKADLSPSQEQNHAQVKQLDKSDKVQSSCNGVASKAVTANGTPPMSDEHKANQKSKCEKKENISTTREERKKHRNRDKFTDIVDSHKSTEQVKEHIVKDLESTKDVRSKDINNSFRDIDRERKEMDRERKERDREKEREQREVRDLMEELKRVKAELATSRSAEAEAKKTLAAFELADKQRKADHHQLRLQHTQLQNKVTTLTRMSRRRSREREVEKDVGECPRESCRARVGALRGEAGALRGEVGALRRDLERGRDINLQLRRDQLRAVESRVPSSTDVNCEAAERWAHLERALSAETRVKLDLLSALGEAKRQLAIREGLITKQEKEIEELKAQMLAVMPCEYMSQIGVPHFRIQGSPLDPNASIYTPKQLCSDA